jgi:hypothetical protein
MPKEAYDKLIAGLQPTVMGYAAFSDGAVLAERDGTPMSWEEFDEWQKGYLNDTLLVHLGNYPTKFDSRDAQPLILFQEGDGEDTDPKDTDPSLLAFIEGDFSQTVPNSYQRSPESYINDEVLIPMLNAYFEKASDPSIDDFLGTLNTKQAEDNVLGTCVRGEIKILGDTGEIKTFSKNALGGKFAWGSMSQTFGFGLSESGNELTNKGGFKKTFKKKGAAAEVVKVEHTTETKTTITADGNKTVEQKTVIHKQEETPKSDTVVLKEGYVLARPMPGLTKSERKAWINKRNNNQLITGWNSGNAGEGCPYIAVHKDNLGSVGKYQLKDETAISAALEKAKNGKSAEQAADPRVIPETQNTAFKNVFQKSAQYTKVMSGVQGLPTMAELDEDEKKYPTFFDKTSLHLEETLRWSDDMKMDLIRNYPNIALAYMKALNRAVTKNLLEHPPKQTSAEKVEEAAPTAKKTFQKKVKVA